jgi:hypothetical protein
MSAPQKKRVQTRRITWTSPPKCWDLHIALVKPHERILIYKMPMGEARCGADFLGDSTPVLMIGGKCPRLRAKSTHLVGHLPTGYSVIRVKETTKARGLPTYG